MPSAVGYQQTLASDLGVLQERIAIVKKESITSVKAIYVPKDNITDPAPVTTLAHLDATTVLSRVLTEVNIYPTGDSLDSKPRMLDPAIVGEENYNFAKNTQKLPQDNKSLQDNIDHLGYECVSTSR
ncbi:unnamed protein product [Moneuplotes crassus]|uniref:ATP synthase subunit beta, mitochondrial n=1 Tax=Euplotes crassus TaxID=5936 RepID=A0AAD1UCD6_EUPCR|nr:unnamed protein product [Moneuplotes crassus]